METLLHGGMSDFITAFYRHQHHFQEMAKYQPNGYMPDKDKKDMTSELHLLVQKLCRVCGGAVSQFQTSTKFELKEPLLHCLKIDVRTDQVGLPSRVCQTCADQLTRAMFQHHQLGTWPGLPHLVQFDWVKNETKTEPTPTPPPSKDCTLAQTLPSLCTISAKHGFLLVPEHTDENRVRFVRLTELATNDVSASYILHIYIDLTWDLSIHGQTVQQQTLHKNPHVPRKVTRENAEELFTQILKINLCPGISGLETICRILSHNGPAVFHDHQNQRLAMEDRFSKTVRHTDCDIVSPDKNQCEACTRYQPVAKQFQEQCLSLSKVQPQPVPTKLEAPPTEPKEEKPIEKVPDTEKTDDPVIEEPPAKKATKEKTEKSESESENDNGEFAKMVAHPASGLSLLAESAVSARLPLTADRPNMREQLLAKAVEKKQACGRCERCLRLDDCGSCDYCLDKPKFGGPNTKRRKCRQRTCVFYRQTQNGSRKRQNNAYRFDSSSLVASLSPGFMGGFRGSKESKKVDKAETPIATSISNAAAALAHQISTTLATQAEKSVEKNSTANNNNAQSESASTTTSSGGGGGRRRPALQCHKCTHCAAPDCAKCRFCLDKPKFGGPGRLKQKCIERRCILERNQDAKDNKKTSSSTLLQQQLATQLVQLGGSFSQDNLKPIAVEAAESDEDVEIDVDDDL